MPAGANHFELDPAGCLLGDRHLGDAPAIPSAVDVIALGQEILGVGKQVATLLDDPSAPARPPVSSSAVASRITSRASGRPALEAISAIAWTAATPSRRVRRGRRGSHPRARRRRGGTRQLRGSAGTTSRCESRMTGRPPPAPARRACRLPRPGADSSTSAAIPRSGLLREDVRGGRLATGRVRRVDADQLGEERAGLVADANPVVGETGARSRTSALAKTPTARERCLRFEL